MWLPSKHQTRWAAQWPSGLFTVSSCPATTPGGTWIEKLWAAAAVAAAAGAAGRVTSPMPRCRKSSNLWELKTWEGVSHEKSTKRQPLELLELLRGLLKSSVSKQDRCVMVPEISLRFSPHALPKENTLLTLAWKAASAFSDESKLCVCSKTKKNLRNCKPEAQPPAIWECEPV